MYLLLTRTSRYSRSTFIPERLPLQVEVFRQPAGNASGLAFDPQGRLVACENRDRRITRIEKNGQIVTLADRFEGKRLNSPNDLTIRTDGSIYFTDPPYGLPEMSQGKELPFSGVYKISPDGKLSLLTKDLPLPNGLVFSLDEKLLYVNDSSSRTIHCYDVNPDGTLTGYRIFAQMTGDPDDWSADGMTLDAEGNVYCAGPKGVWVFSPTGDLKDRIFAPEVITNLAWGDSDHKTLYLTGITSLYRTYRSPSNF